MSKFVIICVLATLAVVKARGINGGENSDVKTEIVSVEKESRLLEVPIIGGLVLKSLKFAWFLIKSLCSIVDFKTGPLALLLNAGVWLLSFKLPVLAGAALMFGACKLSGLCSSAGSYEHEPDHLAHAAEYLDMGTYKYGKGV